MVESKSMVSWINLNFFSLLFQMHGFAVGNHLCVLNIAVGSATKLIANNPFFKLVFNLHRDRAHKSNFVIHFVPISIISVATTTNTDGPLECDYAIECIFVFHMSIPHSTDNYNYNTTWTGTEHCSVIDAIIIISFMPRFITEHMFMYCSNE